MRFVFFLLLLCDVCLTMTACCRSDKNQDDRPRVSCTGMSLGKVPSGIDLATEVLVLTENQFMSLLWSSYQSFPKLHELDLSQNRVSSLKKVPDLILPSLRVLRLNDNRLQELPASAFAAASKLMEIHLRHNQLHTLSEDSFKDLRNLELLDLSQNLIQVLPPSLLAVMTTTSLKTFDVEDNHIKIMPDQFFSRIPNIPYVYLSKNPWVCNCEVGYLSTWLEDQGHNVYVHTGPSGIVNDPESVVCASPSRLKDRPIIDLAGDDYCFPPLDMDFTEAPPEPQTFRAVALPPLTTAFTSIFSTAHIPSFQTATPSQTRATTPTQTHTVTPTITKTTTSTWFHNTTPSQTQSTTLTPTRTTPTQIHTTMHTLIQTTAPTQAHTTEPTRIYTTTTNTFGFLTATEHFWTWTSWYVYYATEFVTSRIAFEMGMEAKPTTTYIIPNTFQTTTMPTPTSKPTPTSTPTATHRQTTDLSMTTKHLLTTGSWGLEKRRKERSVVLFCWWLFIGYLCLCVLLALWLCTISLWFLQTYLRVYLPLARKTRKQKSDTLRLLGHKVKQGEDKEGTGENSGWRGKEDKRVGAISLPMEGAEGVQAMFRSVLFVYKTGEREEGGKGEGEGEGEEAGKGNCETVDAGKADGPATSQESIREGMYSRTLYKEISQDEGITGWRDVDKSKEPNEGNETKGAEMQRWSERKRRSSEPKKRYSLILREERVEGEERDKESKEPPVGNEWLVREWLLGDRGSEGVGGHTREDDWWSLMPLIARGTDFGPSGGDNSTTTNGSTSETHL